MRVMTYCGRMVNIDAVGEEDLLCLVEDILIRIGTGEKKPPRRFMQDAFDLLKQTDWSGRLFELERLIQTACENHPGEKLTSAMLQPVGSKLQTIAEMERRAIEVAFNRHRGHREKVANELGIGVRTLSGKLREYGVPPRAKVFPSTGA